MRQSHDIEALSQLWPRELCHPSRPYALTRDKNSWESIDSGRRKSINVTAVHMLMSSESVTMSSENEQRIRENVSQHVVRWLKMPSLAYENWIYSFRASNVPFGDEFRQRKRKMVETEYGKMCHLTRRRDSVVAAWAYIAVAIDLFLRWTFGIPHAQLVHILPLSLTYTHHNRAHVVVLDIGVSLHWLWSNFRVMLNSVKMLTFHIHAYIICP